MVREAAKHLGTDDSLFQEDVDSEKYKFDVTKPYYTNRELQDALGKATDILVSFLPRTPQNSKDRYAKNALREFATQNVLSLITLMWEGEEFAKRTGAWRMPHVLRALVMRKRSPDRAGTQQQQLVRDLVVEHALTTALGHMRKKNRNNINGGPAEPPRRLSIQANSRTAQPRTYDICGAGPPQRRKSPPSSSAA
jgi:hypothetical protein